MAVDPGVTLFFSCLIVNAMMHSNWIFLFWVTATKVSVQKMFSPKKTKTSQIEFTHFKQKHYCVSAQWRSQSPNQSSLNWEIGTIMTQCALTSPNASNRWRTGRVVTWTITWTLIGNALSVGSNPSPGTNTSTTYRSRSTSRYVPLRGHVNWIATNIHIPSKIQLVAELGMDQNINWFGTFATVMQIIELNVPLCNLREFIYTDC